VAAEREQAEREGLQGGAGLREEEQAAGVNWQVQTRPTASGESVSSGTSQAMATVCIQVPTKLASWPIQK